METVLITGGIGSGKSQVASYIESRGFPVYFCDSGAKALYESVPGLKKRVEQVTGLRFCELKRVFEDREKLDALEALVFPLVLEDIRRWREAQSSPVVFVESAIAAQKRQFDGLFDLTVLVTAPEFLRIRRVMDRDKASRRAVMDRIKAQSPFTPHDYQIPNIAGIEELHDRTDKFLKRYEN